MTEKITIQDFQKLDLRVGKILQVEDHPNANKLYILTVDLAEKEPRQIVAGLKPYYSKEHLINKKAIFIANLEPATIRGVESNGMILAAGNEEKVLFITPEKDIDIGSKIR
ncbi:MAG: methionine--tRNA ligase subunit beta [Nanoarchaeota archaeon]